VLALRFVAKYFGPPFEQDSVDKALRHCYGCDKRSWNRYHQEKSKEGEL
jgi:hypothetical protein